MTKKKKKKKKKKKEREREKTIAETAGASLASVTAITVLAKHQKIQNLSGRFNSTRTCMDSTIRRQILFQKSLRAHRILINI